MDDVQAHSVHSRPELRKRIEFRLRRTPVEAVGPVLAQTLQKSELGTGLPVLTLDLVGPASASKPYVGGSSPLATSSDVQELAQQLTVVVALDLAMFEDGRLIGPGSASG